MLSSQRTGASRFEYNTSLSVESNGLHESLKITLIGLAIFQVTISDENM